MFLCSYPGVTRMVVKKLKEEMKQNKEVEPVSINPIFLTEKWYNRYWRLLKSMFKKPQPRLGIQMELRDGSHTTFLQDVATVNFTYRGATYIIDDELKYFHKGMKLYCLDYHQDFALPIRRKIPLNALQKGIEESGITEVEHATNPIILERFIISKIAEGIMKGQAIDEFLKALKVLIIIILVVVVLTFLITLGSSGMLTSLTNR